MSCKTSYERNHLLGVNSSYAGIENFSGTCEQALRRLHGMKPDQTTEKIAIVKEGYSVTYSQVTNEGYKILLQCALKSSTADEFQQCTRLVRAKLVS